MPAPIRGRFVWHELMTTDLDAAGDFYHNVVGWGTKRWEQDPSYRLWTVAGASPAGGLLLLPEDVRRAGAPPHWLSYVGVSDVEQTVARSTALGARVYVAPRDTPGTGRFAVLADPQGATFALLQPATAASGPGEAGVGDFSWHELATTNWQAAWEFYRAIFGWEHESSFDMGPDGTYWMFRVPGGKRALGGMYTKRPEMAAPAHWMPYVRVKSADAAASAALRYGGRIVYGPADVGGGDRVAQGLDPQGAAFAVHALKARVARAKPAARPTTKPAAQRAQRTAARKGGKRRAARAKATRKSPRKRTARRPGRRRR